MPYRVSTVSGSIFGLDGNVVNGYYNALNRVNPSSLLELFGLNAEDDSLWLRA